MDSSRHAGKVVIVTGAASGIGQGTSTHRHPGRRRRIMDHHLPVGDLDDQTWERVLAVNVTGGMQPS